MSSLKTTRPGATEIYFLVLVLLHPGGVQGQLVPTVALATPVLPETTPTRQKSLSDENWEGSGMPSQTPNFYGSQQDYFSYPVHQTSENTPFLPSLSTVILSETSLLYSQEIGSADFGETTLLGGNSSVIQPTHFSTPKSSDPLLTASFGVLQPAGPMSSISSKIRSTSVEYINSASSLQDRCVKSLSSSPTNDSLKPTPCSNKEHPQTTVSIVTDRSRVMYENFTDILVQINGTEPSSRKPSTVESVSQISHRTTEEPERSPTFTIPSISVTTKPASDNKTGTSISDPETSDGDSREVHYMLFLKSKKCPQMFANELQKELSENTFRSANYSALRWNVLVESCASHLNVSIRTKGPSSLDDIISEFNTLGRENISIRILNRTFYVVHIQKHEDLSPNRTIFDSNSTITIVSDSEFAAYVSVGVSFGVMLVASLTLCCAKFCIRRPRKPLGASRSSQMHLRFEDYTLTPIPRPSSLYVDYYRGSVVGDHYSTTSAGSITSTPTVEQGVVQPFDTCIVPLEDSEAVPEDAIKRPVHDASVVAHVPNLNLHPVANPILAHCINTKSESNERLHPKFQKAGDKNSGLANPTFQRY